MRWRFGLFPLALMLLGCESNHYRPVASPRVAVAGDRLYKNGKAYERGAFYGGVEDVVAENPQSVESARRAHRLMVAGFAFEAVGLTTETAGVTLLGVGDKSDSETMRTIGGALFIGSLIPWTIAIVDLTNAPRHFEDAINTYNDSVSQTAPAQPSTTPAGTPPTEH